MTDGRLKLSRQILEHIRNELTECGAVASNKEFCESWLARDESYMRGLKFRHLDPSAATLATCASKLGYYAQHLANSTKPEHQDWRKRFIKLQQLCEQAMEQQARAQWMAPKRMGL